jgi:hypothetical protein
MVEDVITDGRRIAELLASELTGLERGPLGAVDIVEAEADVTPTADGAFAYAIEHEGDRVGTVTIRPEAAVLDLGAESLDVADTLTAGLSVPGDPPGRLVIERGAAVKAAVDVVEGTIAP